jgi:hypothetical protein
MSGLAEVIHDLIDVISGRKAQLSPDEAAALHEVVDGAAETAPAAAPVTVADQRAAGVPDDQVVTVADQRAGAPAPEVPADAGPPEPGPAGDSPAGGE